MDKRWITAGIGIVLGGLAVVFFSSEGLVQYFRHGMGSFMDSSSSSSSDYSNNSAAGAVAVQQNSSHSTK